MYCCFSAPLLRPEALNQGLSVSAQCIPDPWKQHVGNERNSENWVCLQLSCWRAHPAGISSVRCAGVHGGGGQDLLLVASLDCTVSLWSLQGGLVGVLGKHTWTLSDRSTWQDARVLPLLKRDNASCALHCSMMHCYVLMQCNLLDVGYHLI